MFFDRGVVNWELSHAPALNIPFKGCRAGVPPPFLRTCKHTRSHIASATPKYSELIPHGFRSDSLCTVQL